MGPAYNEQGVEHLYCKGVSDAEMNETYKHAEAMRSTNTASGKDRNMRVFNPAVSQKQFRFMKAAEHGDIPSVSPKVGHEFTAGFQGRPGSVKRLPKAK